MIFHRAVRPYRVSGFQKRVKTAQMWKGDKTEKQIKTVQKWFFTAPWDPIVCHTSKNESKPPRIASPSSTRSDHGRRRGAHFFGGLAPSGNDWPRHYLSLRGLLFISGRHTVWPFFVCLRNFERQSKSRKKRETSEKLRNRAIFCCFPWSFVDFKVSLRSV